MSSPFMLRSATPDDAFFFFRLRNDLSSRTASISPQEIALSEHLAWYQGQLNSSSSVLKVGEYEGCSVGIVRYETKNGECYVSWIIAPEYRGRGFGKKILSEFLPMVEGEVLALIKEENLPSRRIAESAGFVIEAESNGVLRYRRS